MLEEYDICLFGAFGPHLKFQGVQEAQAASEAASKQQQAAQEREACLASSEANLKAWQERLHQQQAELQHALEDVQVPTNFPHVQSFCTDTEDWPYQFILFACAILAEKLGASMRKLSCCRQIGFPMPWHVY